MNVSYVTAITEVISDHHKEKHYTCYPYRKENSVMYEI